MANYIPQVGVRLPYDGANIIRHYVETIEEPTFGALDTSVNAFLASLIALDETPVIVNIEYTKDSAGNFSSQIHYCLIGKN